MGERFFTPKSLVRVCQAVEWEDELVWYKDGTTNMRRFMEALALLYGRWLIGWSFYDFANALESVASEDFLGGFVQVLQGIPARIAQVRGFYEGLWGALPRAGPRPRAFGWMLPEGSADPKEVARRNIEWLFDQLRAIVEEKEEGAWRPR